MTAAKLHGLLQQGLRLGRFRAGALAFALGLPLAGAALLTLAAPQRASAQSAAKIIEGKVYDGSSSTPLSGSIVYLQDQKTNMIRTFISTQDGSYRFGQLPADTDYKLWARFKDSKSKEKSISAFDNRLDVVIDFHIEH